jgi:hypothetical protein
MSLTTGRCLNCTDWTPLPMPQDVINRVHVLARRSNANQDLIFAWRDGTPIIADAADNADADNSDDDDYDPDDDSLAGDYDEDDEYTYPFKADSGHDDEEAYNPPVAGMGDNNNHLFQVNNKSTLLDTETAETFHHLTVKLLHLSKRARPDIQTAVAFLTTPVRASDEDDWKKLKRVIQYLRGSVELPLTLEADDMRMVQWWVDGSFAVHPDMKSHTGAVMSIGKGAQYAASKRQKLNTRSSTEAELVAVDDVMAQVMCWTRYFLKGQGYDVEENIIYQDNQSTMLLEKNGRKSIGK